MVSFIQIPDLTCSGFLLCNALEAEHYLDFDDLLEQCDLECGLGRSFGRSPVLKICFFVKHI